jgi:hypothetical protein
MGRTLQLQQRLISGMLLLERSSRGIDVSD